MVFHQVCCFSVCVIELIKYRSKQDEEERPKKDILYSRFLFFSTEKWITFLLNIHWAAHPLSEIYDWTLILQKSTGAFI